MAQDKFDFRADLAPLRVKIHWRTALQVEAFHTISPLPFIGKTASAVILCKLNFTGINAGCTSQCLVHREHALCPARLGCYAASVHISRPVHRPKGCADVSLPRAAPFQLV